MLTKQFPLLGGLPEGTTFRGASRDSEITMPNHARCWLTLEGPADEIERFRAACEVPEGTPDRPDTGYSILHRLYPRPTQLEGIVAGTAMIDGERVTNFRHDADGKAVAVADEERAQLLVETGATNWYDWCLNNWGTKWGDYHTLWRNQVEQPVHDCYVYGDDGECDEELHEYTGFVFSVANAPGFVFDSAWSPPSEGILHISRAFPALKFTLTAFERGAAYQTQDEIRNGTADTHDADYGGGLGG